MTGTEERIQKWYRHMVETTYSAVESGEETCCKEAAYIFVKSSANSEGVMARCHKVEKLVNRGFQIKSRKTLTSDNVREIDELFVQVMNHMTALLEQKSGITK